MREVGINDSDGAIGNSQRKREKVSKYQSYLTERKELV
jgi:hypothetical protein